MWHYSNAENHYGKAVHYESETTDDIICVSKEWRYYTGCKVRPKQDGACLVAHIAELDSKMVLALEQVGHLCVGVGTSCDRNRWRQKDCKQIPDCGLSLTDDAHDLVLTLAHGFVAHIWVIIVV